MARRQIGRAAAPTAGEERGPGRAVIGDEIVGVADIGAADGAADGQALIEREVDGLGEAEAGVEVIARAGGEAGREGERAVEPRRSPGTIGGGGALARVDGDALKAGGRPQWGHTADWGRDPLVGHITTHTAAGAHTQPAPDVPGNYLNFYARLADYLQGRIHIPAVTAQQVEQVMRLLAQGALSHSDGRWV